jgi:hypothetical protein
LEEITQTIIEEFKSRNHISHNEDDNIKNLLAASYVAIQGNCGEFDIQENIQGRELVLERARYAYNDALEFFEDNFLSNLNSFGLTLAFEEEEETDEEV